VVIATVPGDKAQLLAALLAYRVVYYLFPLLLAALLLAWHESRAWHAPARELAAAGQSLLRELSPPLLAALVFAGGLILLLSGSPPAEAARMHDLKHFLPLPFVEASHLAASLAGTLLLFLAPGLLRRLDGAFVATRALLIAAILFSLAKGFDYEEAAILTGIGAALQWSRAAFYRKTALIDAPLSTGWIAAALTAILAATFAGFFAYKHVAYDSSLWWQFSLRGDAPRFLRTLFGIAVLLTGLALWRLFAPSARASRSNAVNFDQIAPAIAIADQTDAFLAYTGDKRFLLADEGDAFLMYRAEGANWIMMGDPVGNEARWSDLLWKLREKADAAQGRILLYQISARCLPHAIDLGLSIVKYGEEARVDLGEFSLTGPQAKSLRHAERRAIQEGAVFAVIAAADVPAHADALKAVSDDWLAAKKQREKAFSLGSFDPAYMARFPVRRGAHRGPYRRVRQYPCDRKPRRDVGRSDAPRRRHSLWRDGFPVHPADAICARARLCALHARHRAARGSRRAQAGSGLGARRRVRLSPRRDALWVRGAAKLQGEVRDALGAALYRRAARHGLCAGHGRRSPHRQPSAHEAGAGAQPTGTGADLMDVVRLRPMPPAGAMLLMLAAVIALAAHLAAAPYPRPGAQLPGLTYEAERASPSAPLALIVTSVQDGSAAAKADIAAGDVIDRIDGRPIPSVSAVARAVKSDAAKGVMLAYSP
jgi:lysylphosphatidylglycerol synthetase-like protein (DUF2156 family)